MRRMCKTFFFCFFVSSSPSVSVYFSFTLPLPPSVVSVSLCLPLSFLFAVFLGLSTARLLDGIHRFSWAARGCDPPAKNQTALPTARLVHKETRMLTHTHTLRLCQCHKERDCTIRPPHRLNLQDNM